MEYVITFKSTNLAIRAEQCLLKTGTAVTVMPLPSQIHAGCGICLRVSQTDMRAAMSDLQNDGIAEFELYARARGGGKYSYTKADKGIFMESESLLAVCDSGG